MSCLRLKAVAILVVVGWAMPGAAMAASAPPASVPLTQGWQYRADPGDRGLAEAWEHEAGGSGWRAVSVPSVFDVRALPNQFGGTTGWYRVTFRGPSVPKGFSWAVHFEQG